MNTRITLAVTLVALLSGCEGATRFVSDASLDGSGDVPQDGVGDTHPADTMDDDGADPDAVLGCTDDGDCADGETCNGAETCGVDGTCVGGSDPVDGTPCELSDGTPGSCLDGSCLSPECGDGVHSAIEECDDGNAESGDGCDPDCRYSCHSASECDDGNECTTDTCSLGGTGFICRHVPHDGTCDDSDPCTGPDRCADDGSCLPGPAAPRWYPDADHDGFGAPGSGTCSSAPPPGTASNSLDCCDGDSEVNPAQDTYFPEPYACAAGTPASFDYDCDGAPERRWTTQGSCVLDSSTGACTLVPGWVHSEIPACGQPGDFITSCLWLILICEVGETEERIQECR